MGKTTILVIFILCQFTSIVFSQDINPSAKRLSPKVEVIAKTYLDSIVIRWAPNLPEVWQYGNRYGYVIERSTLASDTSYFLSNPEKIVLTPKPVKPVALTDWESLAQKEPYAAIAAQAIYGESFEVVDQSDALMTFFNQAKEMENRFSFSLFAADQSVAVAQAHGLRFVDRTVKENEKYLYRVSISVPDTSVHMATGFVYIATQDTVAIPRPRQLKLESGDHAVQLSWNKVYYEHTFSSYIIERADDLAKGFQRIEQPPLVNPTELPHQQVQRMYVTDSLPENGVTYYYRIRGVTPFGEMSLPSDTVSGMGIAAGLPIQPILNSHQLLPDGTVSLQWDFPETYNHQIQGFFITCAKRADGRYDTLTESLISPKVRKFIDKNPLPVNYYVVTSVDRQGRINHSLPALVQLEDSIPPLSPTGLEGQIDTSGIVTITWISNTESDLAGYRVLMANKIDDPFVQVSDHLVRMNKYADTTIVKTLSKYIFYKVVAVDKHYNRSQPSEVLRLARPDIVPPAPPVFRQAVAVDSAIQISWIPSPSEDVKQHLLFRRQAYHNLWESIATFDSKETVSAYADQEVVPGTDYEYRMVAVDETGLESDPSISIKVSMIEEGLRKAFTQFYGKADRTAKHVQLAWNYPSANVEKYLLYRTIEGQPLRLLKALPHDHHSFLDRYLTVNTTYTYRIQAVYADGGQSPLSEVLVVKY